MMRPLLSLMTALALLLGTGAFNLLCRCELCPAVVPSEALTSDASDESVCCCCAESPDDGPAEPSLPGKAPTSCPCLYWTGAPLTHPEFTDGSGFVKRSLTMTPLLVFASQMPAPLPAMHTIALTHPPAPDDGVRPQARHCIWTI